MQTHRCVRCWPVGGRQSQIEPLDYIQPSMYIHFNRQWGHIPSAHDICPPMYEHSRWCARETRVRCKNVARSTTAKHFSAWKFSIIRFSNIWRHYRHETRSDFLVLQNLTGESWNASGAVCTKSNALISTCKKGLQLRTDLVWYMTNT